MWTHSSYIQPQVKTLKPMCCLEGNSYSHHIGCKHQLYWLSQKGKFPRVPSKRIQQDRFASAVWEINGTTSMKTWSCFIWEDQSRSCVENCIHLAALAFVRAVPVAVGLAGKEISFNRHQRSYIFHCLVQVQVRERSIFADSVSEHGGSDRESQWPAKTCQCKPNILCMVPASSAMQMRSKWTETQRNEQLEAVKHSGCTRNPKGKCLADLKSDSCHKPRRKLCLSLAHWLSHNKRR